jgi:oligopeptide/dipeptide ABC transporter ATP-binding protein
MSGTAPILEVENLSVTFGRGDHEVHAATGVSLVLRAGHTLCLVGESGSGKSVTALALMGLHGKGAHVVADRLTLAGESIVGASPARLAAMRGRDISMIFQDPMSSLNPAFTIGFQIAEAIRLHEAIDRDAARKRALDMLEHVRIPDARRHLDSYPHALSGGMRQRAMIAMALACRPKVLIADEPTTALDVTVQAQILNLMNSLRQEFGTAVLLITHDFGVVAEMADEVAVMYAGRVVEKGPVGRIFDAPVHPYTAGLLVAVPDHRGERQARLCEIPGNVPRLTHMFPGCAFAPRCAHALPSCATTVPELTAAGCDQMTACGRHGDIVLGRSLYAPQPETNHA